MCLWRYLECIYRKYVELISVHALIKLFFTYIQQNAVIIDNMIEEK